MNPIGSGLVLGLFFLVLVNKNYKKYMMRPFNKHWIRLSCPESLNLCQGQDLDLG